MFVCALVALALASRSSDAFSASSSSRAFAATAADIEEVFEDFAQFLISQQLSIISEIEEADGKGTFTNDRWGCFDDGASDDGNTSGGKTRVIERGDVVEKGACSLTIIRNGKLTEERAKTIQGRQEHTDAGFTIDAGDEYCAAALSIVLHTRNPWVPTFRSDVRIFLVKSKDGCQSSAWFGGGSDLTPYYLNDEDVAGFHAHLKETVEKSFPPGNEYNLSHAQMKESCDDYFYLPARSEHRGTGGIFFDDLPATRSTLEFVRDVAQGWMPSWLPIVRKHASREYSDEQKHWQCLRRGRYLEFNLLYDRGVKFGLANANPRVEGVMVSASPQIAFDYNHVPKPGSEEERLVRVLKQPKDWV